LNQGFKGYSLRRHLGDSLPYLTLIFTRDTFELKDTFS